LKAAEIRAGKGPSFSMFFDGRGKPPFDRPTIPDLKLQANSSQKKPESPR
jgi:hypothetical protein